jgi:predicted Mrr-cat superfamily restriction endonuclease
MGYAALIAALQRNFKRKIWVFSSDVKKGGAIITRIAGLG